MATKLQGSQYVDMGQGILDILNTIYKKEIHQFEDVETVEYDVLSNS